MVQIGKCKDAFCLSKNPVQMKVDRPKIVKPFKQVGKGAQNKTLGLKIYLPFDSRPIWCRRNQLLIIVHFIFQLIKIEKFIIKIKIKKRKEKRA